MMLDIPTFAEAPLWYAGLIWALTMGWACSSYASNFSYRLPRGETPFGREPYCGDCDSKLTPKDLFPIFSYALTGGKCRHCGAQVPYSYFLLEVAFTLYVGLCYAGYGFGDMFLLLAFLGMILQISAMMAWDDDYVSPTTTMLLLMIGLIFSIMQGAALSDGMIALFFGMFGALLLQSILTKKPPNKDVYGLPKWIWLVTASAPWLEPANALWFVGLGCVFALLIKLSKSFATARAIALAQAPALLIAVWVGL